LTVERVKHIWAVKSNNSNALIYLGLNEFHFNDFRGAKYRSLMKQS
jgi:hypothetical protein